MVVHLADYWLGREHERKTHAHNWKEGSDEFGFFLGTVIFSIEPFLRALGRRLGSSYSAHGRPSDIGS